MMPALNVVLHIFVEAGPEHRVGGELSSLIIKYVASCYHLLKVFSFVDIGTQPSTHHACCTDELASTARMGDSPWSWRHSIHPTYSHSQWRRVFQYCERLWLWWFRRSMHHCCHSRSPHYPYWIFRYSPSRFQWPIPCAAMWIIGCSSIWHLNWPSSGNIQVVVEGLHSQHPFFFHPTSGPSCTM